MPRRKERWTRQVSERRKFTDYEKKTVYARGNGRCAICGKPLKFDDMTIDHKIPLSRGGTNEFNNLQPACLTCNIMKGNLEVSEFFGKLKEIYKFSKRQRFHKIIVGDKIW